MSSLHFVPFILYISKLVVGQFLLEKSVALVEYEPIAHSLPLSQKQEANANRYIDILVQLDIPNHNIFMVIFPEATLDVSTKKDVYEYFAPEIKVLENPCGREKEKYPEFLRILSCGALKYGTALLVNTLAACPGRICSTDVIFNSDGSILMTLFKDDRVDNPVLHIDPPITFEIPAWKSFTLLEQVAGLTVFKITISITSPVFGFRYGWEKMLEPKEDRFYLVTGNWISELPFLTSLQVCQMWAQEYNLTIFQASASNPNGGTGGTAIYHNKLGPILMDILGKAGTRFYIYKMFGESDGEIVTPKIETDEDILAKELDDFMTRADPSITNYKSVLLETTKRIYSRQLCYENENYTFCCNFHINITVNKSLEKQDQYVYHLVAYKGPKSYSSIFNTGGVELCAVIACTDNLLSSCGKRFSNYDEVDWIVTFENLVVSATFAKPYKEGIYYSSQFPNSLLASLRPIHPNFTNWGSRIVDQSLERSLTLLKPQNKILTFGIFARNFSIFNEDYDNGKRKRKLRKRNRGIRSQPNYAILFLGFLVTMLF